LNIANHAPARTSSKQKRVEAALTAPYADPHRAPVPRPIPAVCQTTVSVYESGRLHTFLHSSGGGGASFRRVQAGPEPSRALRPPHPTPRGGGDSAMPNRRAFLDKGTGRPRKYFGLKLQGRLKSNVTRASRAEHHETNSRARSLQW